MAPFLPGLLVLPPVAFGHFWTLFRNDYTASPSVRTASGRLWVGGER